MSALASAQIEPVTPAEKVFVKLLKELDPDELAIFTAGLALIAHDGADAKTICDEVFEKIMELRKSKAERAGKVVG